ncbi:MAG: CRTAC1 family protein [Verrucomicrobia bacterium]|nr:CRTAC1 family protein [Verrucomicrobiota bacterium]
MASASRLTWLLTLLLQGICGSLSAAEGLDHAATLNLLEERKRQQIAAAQAVQAFHGFQFSDRILESNIRFAHQIVDDAGKDYKAAHYDHGNGMAVADVDGDGLLDVYFTTQLGTNQLWRNLGRGKFEEITQTAGVGLPDQIAVTASFADVDNDGDPDLFVTTVRHGNHLFDNLGRGRFRDITKEAGLEYVGHSSGAVFFDFDNDGLLDLFLANVGIYTIEKQGRGGYYIALTDAFWGQVYPERTEFSILYRNLGGKRFKDVSKELNLQDGSWSGDATFVDFNQDTFPDLYVLNMQGDNHYYENQGGKAFVEKTATHFPKTPWGAMGVKFFDFNQDSLLDLFVTDMHSDMTQPQTEQALKFRLATEKAKSEAFCAIQWTEQYLQGSTNNIFGNAFYQNQGNGKFVEVSDALGVETYWPWGMSVGDLNADGYEDIFVSAGMGYPFRYGINSVLLNEGGKRFFDSEFLLGVEPRAGGRTEKEWFTLDCDGADKQHPECAGKTGRQTILGTLSTRSSAIFDLDDDGDLDLVTNELNDCPQVLVSNLAEKRSIHFLKVRLIGTKSNRDGLGATVKVRVAGKVLTQSVDGKSGYLSQSAMPLYFGLGDATKVEAVEVLWPSGRKQTLDQQLPINGLLPITESGP